MKQNKVEGLASRGIVLHLAFGTSTEIVGTVWKGLGFIIIIIIIIRWGTCCMWQICTYTQPHAYHQGLGRRI